MTVKTPVCPVCHKAGELNLTDEEWHWYLATGILPDAAKQEQMTTGTHPRCWGR